MTCGVSCWSDDVTAVVQQQQRQQRVLSADCRDGRGNGKRAVSPRRRRRLRMLWGSPSFARLYHHHYDWLATSFAARLVIERRLLSLKPERNIGSKRRAAAK